MNHNLIEYELSKENEDQIIQSINAIESQLPFMVSLSIEERLTTPKMSKKALDFVERSLTHSKENPKLIPPFITAQSLEMDVVLMKQLMRFLSIIQPLCQKMEDTYMQVSAEAYAAARVFYRTVKEGIKTKVERCEYIADDLGYFYKRQFSDNSTPSETVENPANSVTTG